MPIDHAKFVSMLGAEFPEVITGFYPTEVGILHCEMAAFRRSAEEAMDAGRFWNVERYFQFLERVWEDAGPEVRNAVEVSFLEDLALGEFTPARHLAVKERMPRPLRKMLEVVDGKWR